MSRGERYFAMASGTDHRFSWSVGCGLLTDDTQRSSVPPCSSLGRGHPGRARQSQAQSRHRPGLVLLQLGHAIFFVEVRLEHVPNNGRGELPPANVVEQRHPYDLRVVARRKTDESGAVPHVLAAAGWLDVVVGRQL